MTRLALGLHYDGTAFSGWQSQPHRNTVQDVLEDAIAQFAGERLPTTVAGRTDAGVHALGQVIHLDTVLSREPFSWVRGVNAFLPPTIALQWAKPVDEAFHARFAAFERTYYYALYTGPHRAPLVHGRAGYLMLPPGKRLDVEAMREAAACLIGEHDFSAFRAAECQARSPVKTMYEIRIHADRDWVFLRFRASAFLHHMVRNLMGCLVAVGRGRYPASWLAEVLASRQRSMAAPTFMPDGLYLAGVRYPEPYGIPAADPAGSLFHGVFADAFAN
ncbi:tRNA pseudouridine(38-40) synthase TruA [Cupriavidus gilardii]|uniref:tRNA pseudouridine synthase A n=1 Tax=Cupriavidus gilardii TaxID=82541 RepID=A0A6N1BH06_9BURK|nr:tRNA pseudouridine(38-40) synthase TruA [Cupriavidus gilardii]KAB0597228.1 tRNA pseudouridine(38-40) synthase TruA [Cupriavidus gilardii]MCT9012283.1 tRNA pseudouridine(38-40) synthase TruA [Cupriavidus gilardii]MCT9053580.1 tRNA pseudouridine(38-40) synthase TruA [Cupriavidus gilardii]MCT9073295.1 tRNA pseudouridine(38-40) synthase TruA [Cupriavidus gilardii]MCT9114808.1 tRNA pseudouridine(38-40) synthase TruA [Cupriavidus gilardii]